MKSIMMALVAFCCAGVSAKDFTLKSTLSGMDFDWSSGESYVDGEAPSGADAFVCIPSGMEAWLSPTNSASWAFVNGYVARIRPMGMTSKLVVCVPAESEPATLSSEVTYLAQNIADAYDRGCFEKTGGGELKLAATGQYSYYITITVSEGTMSLLDGATSEKYYFDTFNVASNATLNLLGTDATSKSITVCRKFFGEGTINCRNGALQTYNVAANVSRFSGKLTGSSARILTACSPIYLTGTNSTASGAIDIETGVPLYVKSLGMYNNTPSQSSSIGAGSSAQIQFNSGSAGVVYLGEGDETDVELSFRATVASGMNYIDGGAEGGLVFRPHNIGIGTKSAAMQQPFVLQGSNRNDCVFYGRTFQERWDGASPANWCPFHIVKRGTGTWLLKQFTSSTSFSGGVSVEEGTLKYDTIDEPGTLCSFGYSTNLYEAYRGTISNPVPWAISLGTAAGTEGTIEYCGESSVTSTNRLVALKGDGRIRQNVEMPFRLRGIVSDGDNPKTLTLDGTGTAGNEILGISDAGHGAISVAKEGSGTWTLAATNSFRGSLAVKGGTLNVCAPNWNWFKFIDRQGFTNETYKSLSKDMYIRELGFFDRSGMTQTIGLQFSDDWRCLLPGEFALGKNKTWEVATAGREWNCLFDDTTTAAQIRFSSNLTTENESTWVPVVIRLPENANPVETFDISYPVNYTKSTRAALPCFFEVAGSMDGLSWTTLFVTNNICPLEDGAWMTSGKYTTAGKMATTAHTGVSLPAPGASIPGPLAAASCVSVAANCTLKSLYGSVKIKAFGLDMETGGGTVDGFTFEENGTLTLFNMPDAAAGEIVASFSPVNCTGVENMGRWNLAVNGETTTKYRASVAGDGTVRVVPLGFRIIIR